jgi:hypothetical protein
MGNTICEELDDAGMTDRAATLVNLILIMQIVTIWRPDQQVAPLLGQFFAWAHLESLCGLAVRLVHPKAGHSSCVAHSCRQQPGRCALWDCPMRKPLP